MFTIEFTRSLLLRPKLRLQHARISFCKKALSQKNLKLTTAAVDVC
ncbi:hypothetical protein [Hydrogenophaga sp. OTU3427]